MHKQVWIPIGMSSTGHTPLCSSPLTRVGAQAVCTHVPIAAHMYSQAHTPGPAQTFTQSFDKRFMQAHCVLGTGPGAREVVGIDWALRSGHVHTSRTHSNIHSQVHTLCRHKHGGHTGRECTETSCRDRGHLLQRPQSSREKWRGQVTCRRSLRKVIVLKPETDQARETARLRTMDITQKGLGADGSCRYRGWGAGLDQSLHS